MRFPSHKIKQTATRHLRRWRFFFQDKKGIASLDFLVILPFLLFFLLVGIDFMRWQITVSSVQNVAQETVQQIEQQGGMNYKVERKLRRWMEITDLNPEQWSIVAKPVGDQAEEWTVTFQTHVPFYAFSLFGMKVSVPIEVTRLGVLHKDKKDSLSIQSQRGKRKQESSITRQGGVWR